MGCLPDGAVEKSVNGGSRRDRVGAVSTDHSQPSTKQTRIRRRLKAQHRRPTCRRLRTGKCISHPGLHGFEKAPMRRSTSASWPTSSMAVATSRHPRRPSLRSPVNVAGKVGPRPSTGSRAGQFDILPC